MVNFPQMLREAFLAYRLNTHELTDLVGRLRAGEDAKELEKAYEHYIEWTTDWREGPGDFDGSVAYLKLPEMQEELSQDEVWTPFQRALYRRLSQPDYDPTLESAEAATAGSAKFVETVLSHFSEWDRNKDTRLEAQELDFALRLPQQDPPTAAALALIRGNLATLGNCFPADGTGLSLRDLNVFASQGIPGHPTQTARLNATFDQLLNRAESLEPAKPVEEERIDPAFIDQGPLGSCVLLSASMGLAPEEFSRRFKTQEDGHIRVDFGDNDYEIVGDLTLAERLLHAHGADQERWPGLLESAMGQRLYRKNRPKDNSLFSAMEGIPPEEAILAVYGKQAVRFNLDEISLKATEQVLQEVVLLNLPAICGSRPTALGDFVSTEELYNGIANGHAYAITGYDQASRQVELVNPWRSHEWKFRFDGQDDGSFQLPLEDFYASFRWIARPEAGLPDSSQV